MKRVIILLLIFVLFTLFISSCVAGLRRDNNSRYNYNQRYDPNYQYDDNPRYLKKENNYHRKRGLFRNGNKRNNRSGHRYREEQNILIIH